MALIKCPECNQEISDKAKVCIHCGYPIKKALTQNSDMKNKISLRIQNAKDCFHVIAKKAGNIFGCLVYWIKSAASFICNIPVVGTIVCSLLLLITVISGIILMAFLVDKVMGALFNCNVTLGLVIVYILMFGSMDIIAYFASYKWGRKSKWYFWVCIMLTVLFPIIMMTV